MSISAKIYDVVQLTTGQEGTIVDISRADDKMVFAIETDPIDPEVELVYALPEQIEKVLWVSS